ncbi:hypothetical protein BDW62DRAFT_157059 [Aspergillus aurantiobrunneus]
MLIMSGLSFCDAAASTAATPMRTLSHQPSSLFPQFQRFSPYSNVTRAQTSDSLTSSVARRQARDHPSWRKPDKRSQRKIDHATIKECSMLS